MSYDLFLKSESGSLSSAQCASYFSQRPCYTINGDQAFYENENTGVYFYFDCNPDDPSTVAFNLNYLRPHFFGLEAAPEVGAFVNAFDLSVDDPQSEGMGDGPFSIEGFLRGWNAGNRFGYQAILSREDRPETHVYPTAGLERVWNWNFQRQSRQNDVGDALFVPRIMFLKGLARARAAVVWPDACPIYMPKVDLVLVIRDELSSRRNPDDPREVTMVSWADIEAAVSAYPYDDQGSFYRLAYDSAPPLVSEFVRSLPLVPPERDIGLAYDGVLNAELADEVSRAGEPADEPDLE